jgi:hypothetical protein
MKGPSDVTIVGVNDVHNAECWGLTREQHRQISRRRFLSYRGHTIQTRMHSMPFPSLHVSFATCQPKHTRSRRVILGASGYSFAPWTHRNAKAHQKYARITEAYTVLKDPAKRRLYDEHIARYIWTSA